MFTNTSVGKGLGNDVVIDLLSDDDDNDDDQNDDDNDDEEPTNTAVNSNDGAATTTATTTNNNNNNTDPGSDGAKTVNRSKTLYNPYAKNKSLPPSLSTITNENNSHNNISKSKKRKTISSSSLSGVRRGIEPHSLKSRKQRLQEEEQRQQHSRRKLQVGLVLEEDLHLSTDESSNVVQNYIASQRLRLRQHGKQELYHDPDFPPVPSSIHGIHKTSNKNNGDNAWSAPVPPKCRCNKPCRLRYKQPSKSNTAVTTENVASGRRGRNSNHNLGRPFYVCAQTTNNNNSSSSSGRNKCNFFKWAFVAESLHWYRLGAHTHHRLVDASQGYSANDLVQGKIGDCWFLSALAVVAERPDLIQRLFRNNSNNNNNNNQNPEDVLSNYGMLSVNLFQDGFWKSVVVDNFLPCMVGDSEEERQLQRALVASRDETNATHTAAATATTTARTITSNSSTASSKYNPFAMSDINRRVLRETRDFLEWDRTKNHGLQSSNLGASDFPMTTPITSHRSVVSNDLAYSKAKGQQLWVPLLEKAYAKCHGSYQAISGGHVAEAFLDLTGAPTLQCSLLQSPGFDPRRFWHQLLKWRRQQLPMGCGTDCHNSEAGIVGMHAYSILDVREISNVDQSFFCHHPTIGNVSGFTNHDDGKVRLLRIRNPHGQGEWKGDFSDQSDDVWERLLLSTTASNNSNGNDIDTQFLHRTMKNDGTFWIDYDHFLMGFSNVDVVLAFLGNHAKSFVSNFPTKTSNHRCQRAFQVTVVPSDTGGMVDDDDTIELYVMGIQKTRRGASHGRIDRKKSYKGCDLGILVGDINGDYEGEGMASGHCPTITNLRGKFFGLTRNGHYRLRLDRTQGNSNPSRSLIIMPISFGHPAATDKDLPFTIRFVANAPLMIREISMVPRMDQVLKQFCTTHYREVDEESHFSFDTQSAASSQEQRMVVLEGANSLYRIVQINCLADGGGTVFLYLYVNEQELRKRRREKGDAISFSVEANCRGMVCRTEQGLLEHETVAKGKKFEAAWRRYSCKFVQETQSRLLMVLVQSGQDTEMGSIVCQPLPAAGGYPKGENALTKFLNISNYANSSYDSRGIFNGVSCSKEDFDVSAAAGGSTKLLESRVGIDLELERALAISRGELELQQALEQSRANLPFYRGDTDLQRAIELSRAEAEATTFEGSGSGPHSVRVTSHRTALESDLEKAIKISLEKENKDRKQKISGSESLTFDLRETVDLASQSQKQRPQKEEETIEIIGDEANDQVVSLGCKRQKRELTAEAAMKRWQKKI